MALVAGIDSSTQSCKVVICDADTGEHRCGRRHRRTPTAPRSTRELWWAALQTPSRAAGGLDDVAAVSVGGPAARHGVPRRRRRRGSRCVAVERHPIERGGRRAGRRARRRRAWARRVGVVPVASITATKLRWLADHEPSNADATAAVCLPHDWLTWRLTGSTDIADLRTDRSDASGTGYFAAESDGYQTDLLELAMRAAARWCRRCLVRTTSAGRHRGGRSSGRAPGTTPPRHWVSAPDPATASSRSAPPAW